MVLAAPLLTTVGAQPLGAPIGEARHAAAQAHAFKPTRAPRPRHRPTPFPSAAQPCMAHVLRVSAVARSPRTKARATPRGAGPHGKQTHAPHPRSASAHAIAPGKHTANARRCAALVRVEKKTARSPHSKPRPIAPIARSSCATRGRATSRGAGPQGKHDRYSYPECGLTESQCTHSTASQAHSLRATSRGAGPHGKHDRFSYQECGLAESQRTHTTASQAHSSRATSRGVSPHGKNDRFSYPKCGLT